MTRVLRAGVAGICGALALSALVAPAAHASAGSVSIAKVVVNGGKPVVLGTTAATTVTATVTATDKAAFTKVGIALWHGASTSAVDGLIGTLSTKTASCKGSGTTKTCTVKLKADPRTSTKSDSMAGSWHIYVSLKAANGDSVTKYVWGSASVLRYERLTANATPEPIAKGKTLTVKGALTRADWSSHTYKAYAGRSVKLEFRKKGSTTWSTVKKVTSGSTGALSGTAKASYDGYWRYVYGGDSTSAAVTSAADYVDVK